MILVPRRFAPTGDRFAPEQVIGLPPERVIGFTGMRSRDALILADAKNRLQADPKEVETLRKRLDEQALTDEQRALFNLPPKNGGDAERDAPNSATETTSNTPRSAANNGDGAPAGTADPDAAEADTPDSTANAAPDESRSHANDVDVDAAPAEQRSAQAAAANQPAPHNQDPRATAKQLDYIKTLIAQRPEEARQIGMDAESLSTMSRKKASWAIKRLNG